MIDLEKVFKTNTLGGRLRTFIINLILSVVLVISIFLMFMTKSHIKATYQDELNAIVNIQNQTIEKWLNERELDILFLVNNNDVKELNYDKIKSLFENFVDNQSEFYFVSFVSLDGYSKVDSTFETNIYFGDKNYFIDSSNGLSSISRAVFSEIGNMPVIHFSAPVLDDYNEVVGVVVGAVRLSSVQSIVESFRFGKTGETFILNENNQLLTKRRFDKSNTVLINTDNSKIEKDFYMSYNEQEVLGTYEKSNFERWTIVAQISKDEIYTMFDIFLMYVIVFIVILLVIVVPWVLRFSNKIEQPIQFLLNGSKQIKDGDYGHEINFSSIVDATSEIKELTNSFNSMSNELKSVIDELTTQSTIDVLSKLYNRRELMRLSMLLLNRSILENKNVASLMVDIDLFKKINDNYGHRAGDTAIEMVSNTIKTSVTNTDIAGRYGGEEFVVFIGDTTLENVKKIAIRIRKNVEKLEIKYENHKLNCTCSIGVCFIDNPDKQDNLESIIEKSDQALYEAKNTGRNKVVIYS